VESRAETLSTAAQASVLCSSFKARLGRTPARRLLVLNVVGNKAISYFLGDVSRGHPGGLAAGFEKPANGLGDKVLALWFAQQPIDRSTGMHFDLTQIPKIGLAIFNGQK